jgi:hypothetical protein
VTDDDRPPPPRLLYLDGTEAPAAARPDAAADAPAAETPAAEAPAADDPAPDDPAPLELAGSAVPAPASAALPDPAPTPRPPPAPAPVPAPPAAAPTRAAATGFLIAALALLLAIVASLVPRRSRDRLRLESLPLVAGTILSGLAQAILAVVAGAARYDRYRHAMLDPVLGHIGRQVTEADWIPGNGPMMAMGATVFLSFLVTLPGLLVGALALEGGLRAVGGAVAQEPIGEAVLWLIEAAARGVHALAGRLRDGPRVIDLIARDASGALDLDTCRDRGWDAMTVLDVDGAFYRVVSHSRQAAGWRRHRYRLVPLSDREIVRRARPYRPDDILRR